MTKLFVKDLNGRVDILTVKEIQFTVLKANSERTEFVLHAGRLTSNWNIRTSDLELVFNGDLISNPDKFIDLILNPEMEIGLLKIYPENGKIIISVTCK